MGETQKTEIVAEMENAEVTAFGKKDLHTYASDSLRLAKNKYKTSPSTSFWSRKSAFSTDGYVRR